MEDKYIILNKDSFQEKINKLEIKRKDILSFKNNGDFLFHNLNSINGQLEMLKQLQLESTPLLPEIEKAYDCGIKGNMSGYFIYLPEHQELKQEYIKNLKLGI